MLTICISTESNFLRNNHRIRSKFIHFLYTKDLSHFSFLQKSPATEYKRIWNRISDFLSDGYPVLSTNSDEHIDMVLSGQYAYISDITTCQTILSLSCDTHIMEEKFFPNMYGIGMQNNSAYKSTFETL